MVAEIGPKKKPASVNRWARCSFHRLSRRAFVASRWWFRRFILGECLMLIGGRGSLQFPISCDAQRASMRIGGSALLTLRSAIVSDAGSPLTARHTVMVERPCVIPAWRTSGASPRSRGRFRARGGTLTNENGPVTIQFPAGRAVLFARDMSIAAARLEIKSTARTQPTARTRRLVAPRATSEE